MLVFNSRICDVESLYNTVMSLNDTYTVNQLGNFKDKLLVPIQISHHQKEQNIFQNMFFLFYSKERNLEYIKNNLTVTALSVLVHHPVAISFSPDFLSQTNTSPGC